MNARWWMAAATLAVIGFPTSRALAQDRGRDDGGRDQRQDQRKDQKKEEHRFNDNNRQAAHEWYQQHQQHLPAGLRQRDRWSSDRLARIQTGRVLDRDLRKEAHSVPRDLAVRLGPAPRGYRYMLVGGQVVLLDDQYTVQDLLTFDINIR
jgi:hypothetical protein